MLFYALAVYAFSPMPICYWIMGNKKLYQRKGALIQF